MTQWLDMRPQQFDTKAATPEPAPLALFETYTAPPKANGKASRKMGDGAMPGDVPLFSHEDEA